MSTLEIYDIIQTNAEDEKNKFNDIYKNSLNTYWFTDTADFEKALKKVISYKWKKQHPEHFSHIYNEDETFISIGYNVFEMVMNESCFPHAVYGTDDKVLTQFIKSEGECFGNISYQNKLWSVIKEAEDASDIIIWTIAHFKNK